MADQPVPEAVMAEEQSFIQDNNFEEQSAPVVSQQYAPSQYAQLGQFRYLCINFLSDFTKHWIIVYDIAINVWFFVTLGIGRKFINDS